MFCTREKKNSEGIKLRLCRRQRITKVIFINIAKFSRVSRQRDERDNVSRLKWDYSVPRRCDPSSHTPKGTHFIPLLFSFSFSFFLFCEYNGENSTEIFIFKVYDIKYVKRTSFRARACTYTRICVDSDALLDESKTLGRYDGILTINPEIRRTKFVLHIRK